MKKTDGIGSQPPAKSKSDEKYRQLVESLMEGIWVLDKEANTTFVNPRMAEMLGYSVDEMMGKHLFYFMDEKGEKEAERLLERRKKGIKEQHEFEFIRKDGTRIYTILETSVITDENGNYSGAMAAIGDITIRRQMEQELREKEHFLDCIFTSIQDGIGIIDTEMNIIHVNPSVEIWYPYESTFVGRKCYEAFHGRTERCEKCPSCRTLETGESDYEIIVKHGERGKETGWLEIYSFPFIDNKTGQMKGVIEFVRDITEQKKTQRKLEASLMKLEEEKAKTESIIAAIGDAISIQDTDFRVLYQNKIHIANIGDQKGKYCFREYEHRDHICEGCPVDMSFKDGKIHTMERCLTGEQNSFYEITASPLKDPAGNIIAGIEVVRNVSKRKRAEEELHRYRLHLEEMVKERTAELEKANEELNRFNRIFVGRELRMVELKKMVKELEIKNAALEKMTGK